MRKVNREIRCFRCSGLRHIASQCQGNIKGEETSALVSSLIDWTLRNFPLHESTWRWARVRSIPGAQRHLVCKAVFCFWKRKSAGVLTADGRTLNCWGYSRIKVKVGQVPAVDIEALVVDKQLLGFDLQLGIDVIKELSGVYLTKSGEACFGGLNRCAAVSIDEPDFSSNKEWTASWKWANGHSPCELSNSVQEYTVPCHARDAYENEILQ